MERMTKRKNWSRRKEEKRRTERARERGPERGLEGIFIRDLIGSD